jgi:ATP-dependent DNA helicase RecG
MDDRELEALLTDIESDRAERKSSLSFKDRVAEAICAFANDLPDNRMPGVVFVGARDDGSCARLPITDRLLQELAAIRSEGNIQPMPSIVVQKRMIRGQQEQSAYNGKVVPHGEHCNSQDQWWRLAVY